MNTSHHNHATTTTMEVLTDSLLNAFKLNLNEHDNHDNLASHQTSTHNMIFHFGHKETILFNFWRTDSVLSKRINKTKTNFHYSFFCQVLTTSCVIIFLVSALYEGLKSLRNIILHQAALKQLKLNT